jgi:hypothetical protein
MLIDTEKLKTAASIFFKEEESDPNAQKECTEAIENAEILAESFDMLGLL